ncbi:hypothetical protein B0H11DRAFT_2252725 [Mycena galericulata]|nr:hypothetical protein B0H11DRAFT_2252725 [Mycena galericulata]
MPKSRLSKRTKIRFGGIGPGSTAKQVVIPVNKTAAQRAAAKQVYNEQLAGLSFIQREEMLEHQDTDMPFAFTADDSYDLGGDSDGEWEDVPTGFHTFPPGEEARLQSHAGGEAVFHQIMEGIIVYDIGEVDGPDSRHNPGEGHVSPQSSKGRETHTMTERIQQLPAAKNIGHKTDIKSTGISRRPRSVFYETFNDVAKQIDQFSGTCAIPQSGR